MGNKVNIALNVQGTYKHRQTIYFSLRQEIQAMPSVYNKPSALFIVAGLENNLKGFCDLLEKNGIIDKHLNWRFADSHLVVLGSNAFQKPVNIEALWLIYALEANAQRAGGCVHFIAGHQALLHINGDWRFNHPPYALKSRRLNKPITAFYGANNELWRWLQTKNTVEQVGKALFVPFLSCINLFSYTSTIEGFNNSIQSYHAHSLNETNFPIHQLLNEEQPYLLDEKTTINAICEQLQVNTIITGTVTNEPFSTSYSGKLLRLPSFSFDSTTTALIRKDRRLLLVNNKGEILKIKTPKYASTTKP